MRKHRATNGHTSMQPDDPLTVDALVTRVRAVLADIRATKTPMRTMGDASPIAELFRDLAKCRIAHPQRFKQIGKQVHEEIVALEKELESLRVV